MAYSIIKFNHMNMPATKYFGVATIAVLLSVNVASAQTLYPPMTSSSSLSGTVAAPTATTAVPATATAATFNALQNDVRFVQVGIRDGFFQPQNLVVAPGSTVVWINQSGQQHTVTADDGSFASGTLSPNGTYSHVFNTTGTYPYYSQNGGAKGGVGMFGVIVVMSSGQTAPAGIIGAPQGQVLGTATDVPNLPNTGAGGMGVVNMVLLGLSGIVASAGILVLRERARRPRQSRPFFFA